MDDYIDDSSDDQYPIPFANVRRRKTLFRPDAYDQVDTSTPNDEAYAKYLQNVPDRSRYEPSKGRRIMSALVAGLSAAGGESVGRSIGIGKEIQDSPYNEAIGDWKLRGAGMEKLAEIEGRRINTQVHVAEGRNHFNENIAQLEQRKDQAEQVSHNADLNRQETARYHDNLALHNQNVEGQTATNQAEVNKIRNRQVDAYKERTAKQASRGSQVSHSISMLNQQKAHDEAVSEILLEQPELTKYFDLDPKSGLIVKLKRNNVGLNVKDVTEPGMFFGTNQVQKPLDMQDRAILKNFQTKLTEKMKNKLSLTMGNIEEMQPGKFEFQDTEPDNLGGQGEYNSSGYEK